MGQSRSRNPVGETRVAKRHALSDTKQSVCFLESNPQLTLLRRGAAEYLGTLLLVLVLIAAKLNGPYSTSMNAGPNVIIAAVGAGSALAGLIFSLGEISGGHFNPLISILQWMSGLRSGRCAIVYTAAQFAGGVCGAILANVAFGKGHPLGQTQNHGHGWLMAELLSSAGLMIVVFGCMKSGRREFGTLGVAAWLTGSIIGLPTAIANPALALGTHFALSAGSLRWTSLALVLSMEGAGMLLAGLALSLLFPKELSISCVACVSNNADRVPARS